VPGRGLIHESGALQDVVTTAPNGRPTREQLAAAASTKLADVVGPDLAVLFVGINPSLYSAAVGHHFARPGNRFWPTLHAAGFTPRLFRPAEQHELPPLGIGITNIAPRPTARADELTAEELRAGYATLVRKLRRLRPATVAFLGVSAYRIATGERDAAIGPQPTKLGGSGIWVLPNPSGLNAHYQLPDLAREYAALRATVI
jgi:double-stranded uracil-DNA glycosylase